MRPLVISDATSVLSLQQEIQRSEESRYDHRLHGVLMVAQGMTCPRVAELLGDAPRSVEYWVHRFEQEGLSGLVEGERPGRPSRLTSEQAKEINRVLRGKPSDVGMRVNLWDARPYRPGLRRRMELNSVCANANVCSANSSSGSENRGRYWREPI